ncbi:patatin-like phospholipase family protein [Thioalbus denitrificans]|nr:patatin-like phospholipase family protein [Thioalbus denitrificans]
MGRWKPVALILLELALPACSVYPVNSPATHPPGEENLYEESSHDRSDSLQVILTFSGGGTRAAAFSYGVLEALRDTEIQWEGRRRRLLDEVDLISSVSGGSFTAAYYGLYGERIFTDFEPAFLKRDVQGSLTRRLLNPWNWIRLGSPLYGKSELAADLYDRLLFQGATFADMNRPGAPRVRINATDMTLGTGFSFTQGQFDWICSDLSRFSVARAVAASSAVPVLFSPVALHNHAGTCGFTPPAWVTEALENPGISARRYRQARWQVSYLDTAQRPYLHLLDGGLADNLGVRGALDQLILEGGIWGRMQREGLNSIRQVVFIVVNAEPGLDLRWDRNPGDLALSSIVNSATTVPINRYSFETLELLRSHMELWRREVIQQRCGARPEPGCAEIDFHLVEVNLGSISDPAERARLQGLPTSFRLPAQDVDALRLAARSVLEHSPAYRQLLHALGGASPAGSRRTSTP